MFRLFCWDVVVVSGGPGMCVFTVALQSHGFLRSFVVLMLSTYLCKKSLRQGSGSAAVRLPAHHGS